MLQLHCMCKNSLNFCTCKRNYIIKEPFLMSTQTSPLSVLSIVTRDHSVGGSYLGCEPMGLFWSLKPAPGEREGLRQVIKTSCAVWSMKHDSDNEVVHVNRCQWSIMSWLDNTFVPENQKKLFFAGLGRRTLRLHLWCNCPYCKATFHPVRNRARSWLQ